MLYLWLKLRLNNFLNDFHQVPKPIARNCVTDAPLLHSSGALLINALMKTTLAHPHKQTLARRSEKSESFIHLTIWTIKRTHRKLPRQIKRKIIDKTPKQQKLLGTFVREDVQRGELFLPATLWGEQVLWELPYSWERTEKTSFSPHTITKCLNDSHANDTHQFSVYNPA